MEESENDRKRAEEVLREKKKQEVRIQAERDYLWSIFNSIKYYIFVNARDYTIEFLNRHAREQFGDLVGKICYMQLGREQPCPECPVKKLLFLEHSGPVQYTVEAFGRILEGSATRLVNPDGSLSVIEVLTDITERKQMEKQLKYLSLHDPLTGLYNWAYFEQEMRRLESGRYNSVGIILCDVDGLKLINDTLGHDTGDALLVAAGDLIKKSFREGDMVARIGGDEFAALLPNSDNTTVENACRRIGDAISRYNAANPEIPLSISVGFAVNSEISISMRDIFKEADNNMYREKLHRSQSARSSIVQTLMKAMEARDFITEGHADRLQDLVADIATAIDLPEHRLTDLRLLAQFHDVGKVGIPDRILFKKGPLTPEETTEMQRHCEIGYRIARSAPDLVPIADWILKHHEWWNGEGYPLGLKGEEIPLECRILAIADAYDAITSERPYRKAMSHEEAVAELRKCAGVQFDPELVHKFVRY